MVPGISDVTPHTVHGMELTASHSSEGARLVTKVEDSRAGVHLACRVPRGLFTRHRDHLKGFEARIQSVEKLTGAETTAASLPGDSVLVDVVPRGRKETDFHVLLTHRATQYLREGVGVKNLKSTDDRQLRLSVKLFDAYRSGLEISIPVSQVDIKASGEILSDEPTAMQKMLTQSHEGIERVAMAPLRPNLSMKFDVEDVGSYSWPAAYVFRPSGAFNPSTPSTTPFVVRLSPKFGSSVFLNKTRAGKDVTFCATFPLSGLPMPVQNQIHEAARYASSLCGRGQLFATGQVWHQSPAGTRTRVRRLNTNEGDRRKRRREDVESKDMDNNWVPSIDAAILVEDGQMAIAVNVDRLSTEVDGEAVQLWLQPLGVPVHLVLDSIVVNRTKNPVGLDGRHLRAGGLLKSSKRSIGEVSPPQPPDSDAKVDAGVPSSQVMVTTHICDLPPGKHAFRRTYKRSASDDKSSPSGSMTPYTPNEGPTWRVMFVRTEDRTPATVIRFGDATAAAPIPALTLPPSAAVSTQAVAVPEVARPQHSTASHSVWQPTPSTAAAVPRKVMSWTEPKAAAAAPSYASRPKPAPLEVASSSTMQPTLTRSNTASSFSLPLGLQNGSEHGNGYGSTPAFDPHLASPSQFLQGTGAFQHFPSSTSAQSKLDARGRRVSESSDGTSFPHDMPPAEDITSKGGDDFLWSHSDTKHHHKRRRVDTPPPSAPQLPGIKRGFSLESFSADFDGGFSPVASPYPVEPTLDTPGDDNFELFNPSDMAQPSLTRNTSQQSASLDKIFDRWVNDDETGWGTER